MNHTTNLTIFNNLAQKQLNGRAYSYYWNQVVNYFRYFSNEDLAILEIGCGTGDMLAKIQGNYKMGVDFSPKMIEIAKTRYPNINFEVMDAENLTINKKFDLIVISNLLG